MNLQKTTALESYFKTENEHWNAYAFDMICEVLKNGIFSEPLKPVELFSEAVNIFTEQHETPIQAVQMFEAKTEQQELDASQKLFVFEWALKYMKVTKFESIETDEVVDVLKSQVERIKTQKNKQPEYTKPITANIRETLKEMMQQELEQLPETLKALDPVQRLNVLCKLMPYVLPKTESVKHSFGEPEQPKKNWLD